MPRSWWNDRRALTVAAAVLLACTFLPPAAAAWLYRAHRVLDTLFMPFRHPQKILADYIRGPGREPTGLATFGSPEHLLDDARVENNSLREEVRRLREENDQLAQANRVQSFGGFKHLPAPVTAARSGGGTQVLIISRGTRHGVQVGQVVIDGANLVGRVTDASPVTATVTTITAPRGFLEAIVRPAAPGPPAYEERVGLLAESDGRSLTVTLGRDTKLRPGDLAHLDDRAWPAEARGYFIGKVTRVGDEPRNPLLQKRVVVQPMADLTHLSRVYVRVPHAVTPGR